MDIPEIYKYNTEFDDSLFTKKIRRSLSGAIIGYYFYPDVPAAHLPKAIYSKFNVDRLNADHITFNDRVRDITTACFCKNYLNSFTSRKSIAASSNDNDKESNVPAVIKFHLFSIGEIDCFFSVRYKTFH
jgi:hypothetical protein